MRRWTLFAITSAVACACASGPSPSATDQTGLTPTPPLLASSTPEASGGSVGWAVSGAEAAQVALVVAFVDAFNAGDMDEIHALSDVGLGLSDCDYVEVRAVDLRGRELDNWLRARFADHDHLVIKRIFNFNPEPSSGAHVVGVEWLTRTSKTLTRLGFPNGIEPATSAKVVFNEADDRIRSFANGPVGGDPELCRPE